MVHLTWIHVGFHNLFHRTFSFESLANSERHKNTKGERKRFGHSVGKRKGVIVKPSAKSWKKSGIYQAKFYLQLRNIPSIVCHNDIIKNITEDENVKDFPSYKTTILPKKNVK